MIQKKSNRVVNETYDAETETRPKCQGLEIETRPRHWSDETETRRSKQRLETFGREVRTVTIQLQNVNCIMCRSIIGTLL